MEKSKSEAIKEKRIAQLRSTINQLHGRILDLQESSEKEVLRLERLRNEENHIQGRISDLERKESDFKTFKFEETRRIEDQKIALIEKEKVLGKEALESKRIFLDASAKLKEAEAKLKTAEAISLRNAQVQQSINDKLKHIEKEKERLVSITNGLNSAKESVDASCAKERALLKEKEKSLLALKEKQREVQDEQDHLRSLISENEEKVKAAAVLRAQAKDILEQAEQKAKDSQLSVDRQWNEIEIQKKNLKVMQLRMDKIIKDKGIEKELKDLESK